MPKDYKDKNVLEAARDRIRYAFNEFDNIYLSVSGGKDSSVMMHLVSEIAEEMDEEFSMLFVDLEAWYKSIIDHIEELIEEHHEQLDQIYWVCLPISLRNAVSIMQPKWTCWNKDKKDLWIRDMPNYNFVINEDNNPFGFFEEGMEFEEFIIKFAKWFNEKNGADTGAGIAIRSDESLNRFRTLAMDDKGMYKDKKWTTRVRINQKPLDVYNFYPIYDWTVEDVWGAVSKFDWSFNKVYEKMYKNGMSVHEQRLCQPFGDDQRNGLNQYKAIESETWNDLLRRVSGVNYGNIYAKTSLLGNFTSEKPDHLNWEEYAVFLLESIGMYSPMLMDHYYGKISTWLEWYEQVEYEETGWTEDMGIEDIPDKHPEDMAKYKYPSWERVAWAIERNDFWMKRLGFSQTKGGRRMLKKLKEKYKDYLIKEENTDDKHLKEWMNEENDKDE